jgi:tetratricopeptide (TPR) repeat protein
MRHASIKLLHARLAFVFLLTAVVAVVYWPGVSGPFLYDDASNFLNNRHIQIQELSAQSLYRAAVSGSTSFPGRPVAFATFAVDHYLAGGFKSLHFKLTNLFVHVVNAILVFFLCRLILARLSQLGGSPQFPRAAAEHRPEVLAALIALMWATHPIQLMSVLYVVQRMTSLSGLFVLAALLCYLGMRVRMVSGANSNWRVSLAGFAVFGLLGLLSKESAALLPLYVLVLDVLLFRQHAPWTALRALSRRTKMFAASVAGMVIVAAVVGAVIYFLPYYAERPFSMWQRVLTEPRAIFFYFSLIAFPRLDRFGIYHDDFPASVSLLDPWTTIVCIIGVAMLLWAAFRLRKSRLLLSLGLLWYFTGHLLESTIAPLLLVQEHRNYLPLLGAIFVIVHLVDIAQRRFPRAAAILPALVAVFAVLAVARSAQWSSLSQFAEHEARHHPMSASAQLVSAMAHTEEGRYEPALAAVRRAVALDPGNALYHINLHRAASHARTDLSQNEREHALTVLHAKRIPSSAHYAFESISRCLCSSCRGMRGPMETWMRTLLVSPANSGDKAMWHYYLGRSLACQDRNGEAIAQLRAARDSNVQLLLPLLEMASLLLKQGDCSGARTVAEELRNRNATHENPRTEELHRLIRNIESSSCADSVKKIK